MLHVRAWKFSPVTLPRAVGDPRGAFSFLALKTRIGRGLPIAASLDLKR